MSKLAIAAKKEAAKDVSKVAKVAKSVLKEKAS